MSFSEDELIAAHAHSMRNGSELQRSSLVGCFYCMRAFDAREVTDWVDEAKQQPTTTGAPDAAPSDCTALCPHCGIDSVIGDATGYVPTPAFLASMHQYWFADSMSEDEPKPQDQWELGSGEFLGEFVIVRALHVDALHDQYPIRLGFATKHTLLGGEDDNLEHVRLSRIEDVLVLSLENEPCLLVLVITSSGAREFIYYTATIESADRCVQRALRDQPELTHYVEEDRAWELYQRLRPGQLGAGH